MWTTLGLIARLAGPTVGEASPISLEWPPLLGCPSATEVEAATLRLVAGAPRPVQAIATIGRDADTWTLRLELRDADGAQVRVLGSTDCSSLAEAAAVILAVAAAPRETSAAPAIADPARAPVEPADELDPVEVTTKPPPRRSPRASLFVHAGAAFGPAPTLVPGVAVGLALLWPRLRIDARATYWGRGAMRLSDTPNAGADLQLVTGGLRACPVLVRSRLALQLCAGVELGGTIVRAVGLAEDFAPRSLWAAGSLAPGLRLRPRPWLALGLELEGVVPFTRREYQVTDASQPLHRTPPLGIRVLAGLEFTFP